jgi:hypothetical protein
MSLFETKDKPSNKVEEYIASVIADDFQNYTASDMELVLSRCADIALDDFIREQSHKIRDHRASMAAYLRGTQKQRGE